MLEGFPERAAADADPACQLWFQQMLARYEHPGTDALGNDPVYLVRGAFAGAPHYRFDPAAFARALGFLIRQ